MAVTHISYQVPSGENLLLLFEAQEPAPLRQLRFVLGGKPQAFRITRITGLSNDSPDITFSGGAAPHEVTVYFAQTPVTASDSASFYIGIDNYSPSEETLHVTAIYAE